MTERPTTPSAPADRGDADRIANALIGLDTGTDPFVAAVRATRMPMIITNPRLADNPVVFANDAFSRLTGYTRDEILGRNCRFLQGPDTDRETVARVGAAVSAERAIEVDLRNYRKSGEPFWNRLLLAPVRDLSGALAYFFASQVDVTIERERLANLEDSNAALMAELAGRLREQQESEAELRFALEAGRFGAWSLDIASGELTTSPTCRANFGRDPALPFSYDELRAAVHPDDREQAAAAVARSLADGTDYDIDFRLMTPEGKTRWVGIRARPSVDAAGEAVRLVGVSLDTTEQKRAERMRLALVELGDVFRDATDASDISSAAVRIIGETLGVGRVGYGIVDPQAETIVTERDWLAPGISSYPGILQFRDYGSFIEDLKRGDTVAIDDVAADPRTAAFAETIRALDVEALVNVPLVENGAFVALLFVNDREIRRWSAAEIAFVREMAERTRIAVERRRAEQERAALAASLEQQVADRTRELIEAEEALRQSQKMEAIGQLTGGVAHDFNNLLTVIRSSADLLRLPTLTEEKRKRYVDAISDTADRAARLTSQLLAFARRQSLKPEIFDVGARVRDIVDITRTLTGSRIVVTVRIDCESCCTQADPSQFETALVNIAANARDAMDGEGRFDIHVREVHQVPRIRSHASARGQFIAISLSDTGAGIPPDRIARIFEPFFTTKEVGRGTGLGLSQVYGFAKQSGGEVDVSSTPGQGTTFTLYLPRSDVAAPAPAPVGAQPGRAAQALRILVVEDNADVGTFSTQLLEELGHETIWASDAQAALATIARGDPFDIVFSDVVMPGMSGVELARALRDIRPDLPVVLTSGYSHVIAQEGTHGFELLRKPYSVETLSKVLREAMPGTA